MILLILSLFMYPVGRTITYADGTWEDSYLYNDTTEAELEEDVIYLVDFNSSLNFENMIWIEPQDTDHDTLWVEDYEYIGFRNNNEVVVVIEIEELGD